MKWVHACTHEIFFSLTAGRRERACARKWAEEPSRPSKTMGKIRSKRIRERLTGSGSTGILPCSGDEKRASVLKETLSAETRALETLEVHFTQIMYLTMLDYKW